MEPMVAVPMKRMTEQICTHTDKKLHELEKLCTTTTNRKKNIPLKHATLYNNTVLPKLSGGIFLSDRVLIIGPPAGNVPSILNLP